MIEACNFIVNTMAFVLSMCLIVTMKINLTPSSRRTTMLFKMCCNTQVLALFSIAAFVTNRTANSAVLIYISNIIFSLSLAVQIYLLSLYLLSLSYTNYIKECCSSLLHITITVSFISVCLIYFTTPLTKLLFYVDERNQFIRGPLYNILYLYCGILLFTSIIKLITNKQNISPRNTYLLLFLFTLETFIVVLQFINKDLQILAIASALANLFFFFMNHSYPYVKNTGCFGIEVFNSELTKLFERKKNFFIITVVINNYINLINHYGEGSNDLNLEISKILNIFNWKEIDLEAFYISDSRISFLYKRNNQDKSEKITKEINTYIKNIKNFNFEYKITVLKCPEYADKLWKIKKMQDIMEKKCAQNYYYFCSAANKEQFNRDEIITNELKTLENHSDDLLIYGQPIKETKNNEFTHAEILTRLNSVNFGIVFPDTYIPLAEKYSCIHKLSLILFEKVCSQINKLLQSNIKFNGFSINFASIELEDPAFAEEIIEIIERHKIPFNKIIIEITESTSIRYVNNVKNSVNILKNKGISFYLDDFGTGYSNLERILSLSFDVIKFDRSIIQKASENKKDFILLKSLVNTCKGVGLKILFEGIETDKEEKMAMDLDVDYLQGYKYSKPIQIDDVTSFFIDK